MPSHQINPNFTLNSVKAATANATVGGDAAITFSTLFNFDFNPDDGIDVGKFDFVGIAAQVPEPSNLIGTLIVAGFGAKLVFKRRQKLAKSV